MTFEILSESPDMSAGQNAGQIDYKKTLKPLQRKHVRTDKNHGQILVCPEIYP